MLETSFLIPIIILLGISVLISTFVSIFKIRLVPIFVFEIIVGIILGTFLRDYFSNNNYTALTDGLYVVGFSLIMFLSGFDADINIITDKEQTSDHHINIVRTSIVLLAFVYLLSLIASFLFINDLNNRILGIILLTITFSSTFAGIVAPLVVVERLNRTGWGNIMITFAFLSELLSIVLLTFYMIATEPSPASLWGILLIAVVFGSLYLGLKIRPRRKIAEGMVFLKMRYVFLALALAVLLSEFTGGEYVLGAFLLGFFLKALGVSEQKIAPFENVGYGLFIPIFFILVGLKIDIIYFINHPKLLLLVLLLFVCFVIVKVPLLYLRRWYPTKTALTSIFLSSCTLVVGVTASHIGEKLNLFSDLFGQALILACILTSIVAPIVFNINFPQSIAYIKGREKGITYGRN